MLLGTLLQPLALVVLEAEAFVVVAVASEQLHVVVRTVQRLLDR